MEEVFSNRFYPVKRKILQIFSSTFSISELKSLRLISRSFEDQITQLVMNETCFILDYEKIVGWELYPDVPVRVGLCTEKFKEIDPLQLKKIKDFIIRYGPQFKELHVCNCSGPPGKEDEDEAYEEDEESEAPPLTPVVRNILFQLVKYSRNLEVIKLHGVALPSSPGESETDEGLEQPLMKLRSLGLPIFRNEEITDKMMKEMNWLMPNLKEISINFTSDQMTTGTFLLKKLGETEKVSKNKKSKSTLLPVMWNKLESIIFYMEGEGYLNFFYNHFYAEIKEAFFHFLRTPCPRVLKKFTFVCTDVDSDDLYVCGILNKFAGTVEEVMIQKGFTIQNYGGEVPEGFPDLLPMPKLKNFGLVLLYAKQAPGGQEGAQRDMALRNTLNIRKFLENVERDYPSLKSLTLRQRHFEDSIYELWMPTPAPGEGGGDPVNPLLALRQIEQLEVSYPTEAQVPAMFVKWRGRIQEMFPNADINVNPVQIIHRRGYF